MKLKTIGFTFLVSFYFASASDTGDQEFTSRDPKFLDIFRQIFQPYTGTLPSLTPSLSTSSQEKVGENYNQYFVNADPYNQNQLLSAVAWASPGSSIVEVPASGGGGGGNDALEGSESGINSMNALFTKLIGDDTSSTSSIISNILSLGTGSMEKVLNRVNAFDSLKCIPRLLCQTVAQRQLEPTNVDTPTSTAKPRVLKRKLPQIGNDLRRNAKTIKFLGVETALEQFMAFLDLVQLKNWSLYPYLKGAYEGSQVKRMDECAQRFQTCPFTDQQLVYYFNNYNGGFFQSLRTD